MSDSLKIESQFPKSKLSNSEMQLLQELYTAIETGNIEEVELILETSRTHDEAEFNLNQMLRPMYDMTPLHLAVGLNNDIIVKLLLKYGADPNCLNCGESVSPLHLSVLYDLEGIMKILLENGGDPKLPDGDKKTCFNLAVENEVGHLLELLNHHCHSTDDEAETVASTRTDTEANIKTDTDTAASTDNEASTSVKNSGANEAEIPRDKRYLPSPPKPQSSRLPRKPDSDTESFFSCRSAETKVSAALTPEKRSKSKDLWLPGYSYQMTDDDTNYNYNSSTDADKSSDTTTLEADESSNSSDSNSVSTPRATSTPRVPTPEEMKNLTEAVKDLGIRIPVTHSTFPILTKRVENENRHPNPTLLRNPPVTSNLNTAAAAMIPTTTPLTSNSTKENSGAPKSPEFSSELQASLVNLELIQAWGNLKIDLIQSLTPTKRTCKSFYNYLLLDPKIIKRANFSGNHLKSDIIKNAEKFERFLSAVFYVGKGCGNRPLAHLVDAKIKLSQLKRTTTAVSGSEKLSKILQIWKSGQGVILHSVFHHSAEREANINEAAMIDAIGINCNQELTNVKKGSYLGTGAVQWTQKVKNQFGAFLLYKCFCSFVVSDAKVFFPHDV